MGEIDMLALNEIQGAESKTYALSYSMNRMRLYNKPRYSRILIGSRL